MKRVHSLESLLADRPAPGPSPKAEEVLSGLAVIETARAQQRQALHAEIIDSVADAKEDGDDISEAVAESVDENGTISMETYMLAQMAVRANPALPSFVGEHYGPSLESYSGGRVTVSQEAIHGDLIGNPKQLFESFMSEFLRGWAFVNTRRLIQRRKVSSLIEDAKSASKTTGTITVVKRHAVFGGKVSQNLGKSMMGDIQSLQTLVDSYGKQMVKCLENNMRMVKLIDDSSPEAFEKTYRAMIAAWKRPDINPSAVNATSLNGDYFRVPYTAQKDPLADAFAKKAFSYVLRDRNEQLASAKGKVEVAAMSPDDIKSVGNAYLTLMRSIQGGPALYRSLIASTRAALNPNPVSAAVVAGTVAHRAAATALLPGWRKYPEQMKPVRKALRAMIREIDAAAIDIPMMILNSGAAFIDVAGKSLKAGR